MVSKPKHAWHGNVIRTIRYYPSLEAEKSALTSQMVTANYTGMPRATEPSRTTENCATRQLSPREEEEVAAVRGAIDEIRRCQDGAEVLDVIKLVDWRKTHTIEGAAMVLHISPRTARRKRDRFILATAKKLRYV